MHTHDAKGPHVTKSEALEVNTMDIETQDCEKMKRLLPSAGSQRRFAGKMMIIYMYD